MFDSAYRGAGESLFVTGIVFDTGSFSSVRGVVADSILRMRHFLRKRESDRKVRGLLAILVCRPGSKAGERLREYLVKYAPDFDWLILNLTGRYEAKIGSRNERDSFPPLQAPVRSGQDSARRGGLFAPKFQWLLKVLTLNGFERKYWGGPRTRPLNITELGRFSGVSQPYASKFMATAEAAGYVKRLPLGFCVQRTEDLLEEWSATVRFRRRGTVLHAAFMYPASGGQSAADSLLKRIRSAQAGPAGSDTVVIGGHFACHLLGLGRSNVHSMTAYISGEPEKFLEEMGLIVAPREEAAIEVVVPTAGQSIFNGCGLVNGVQVADVIQCYLDVRWSPARGREQADFIYRKVLAPGLRKHAGV